MEQKKVDDVEAIIRQYIEQVIHMSLGTCADNKPWVCEVHFVYDDDLNLYFISKPNRRHSQDIAANPNVAGNIVTQHFKGMSPRGVYFEGTAARLDVDIDHPAYKLYHKRLDLSSGLFKEILEDPEGHKFYKITVSDWYLFDSYVSKPSQKYHLPWGSKSNK